MKMNPNWAKKEAERSKKETGRQKRTTARGAVAEQRKNGGKNLSERKENTESSNSLQEKGGEGLYDESEQQNNGL